MSNSTLNTPETGFNDAHFRGALSQFATGVTIITTRDESGGFVGLTISSFNSVSLTPPLVLWSLSNKASSMPLFTNNSHYVINVLAADQASLAERFASRLPDRFDGVSFDLSPTGLPVLQGVAAWFECQNRSQYSEGDHTIFVGEVERCAYETKPALVFHGSRFGTVEGLAPKK